MHAFQHGQESKRKQEMHAFLRVRDPSDDLRIEMFVLAEGVHASLHVCLCCHHVIAVLRNHLQ